MSSNASSGKPDGDQLFGENAAGYQAGRPGYPDALFDLLEERCAIGPASVMLEVGPGTGQATRRLLEFGVARLTAVEPDARLARHLQEELGEVGRGRLELVVSRFESAALASASFDAVVAASSFHWTDGAVALARVKALLKASGCFAVWWNVFHDMSGVTEWSRAIRPMFEGLTMPPSFVGDSHYSLEVEARIAELHEAGFADVRHALFRRPIQLTAGRVRAFYASFSPVLRLAPAERTAWLDRIGTVVDLEFGGVVEHEVLTSLYTCRKP